MVLRCIAEGETTMPTFADRQKDFEARFKLDEELRFKATARRNRLLGLWAARHLGLTGDAADAYAKDLVATQFGAGGDQRVIDKLATDLAAKDFEHYPGPNRLRAPALRRAGQAAADAGISAIAPASSPRPLLRPAGRPEP